nr:unnamed protein product [Callosobruchus analis]
MDLRSTFMLLKVEAFLGGSPLMKLDGQKWRLSKITYAIQAFYGSLHIMNTVVGSIKIINIFHVFTANPGAMVPQFW